jgi:2',3'-cyclic-nucleotide 2'-phosphodiesterase (5'-nucleotidase family)
MKKLIFVLIGILILAGSCFRKKEFPATSEKLTIFFVNDQHGQIDNFSKIAHIIKTEEQSTSVIVACSGDMFSGNPVVDNFPEKGYPMIDLMNRVGFDVCVPGNHDYDYGESILTDRIKQSKFAWICANVDMGESGVPEPHEYTTVSVNSLKVTFLGLVETNGKENAVIPSTHPWRVQNFTFRRAETVVSQYANVKEQVDSDLYIVLSHLGHDGYGGSLGDFQLAHQFPYFDLIIGGHSHSEIDTTVNDIPIYQAISSLNYLGKIELTVNDKEIQTIDYELIDLNQYQEYDDEIAALVDEYNDAPYLNEVIGYSHTFHSQSQVGCFYTDALRSVMNTDLTFQNTGGVRSSLDEGDIVTGEIMEIAPFNNGTVVYNMTVSEITSFLKGTGSGFYYSGMHIEQVGDDIHLLDENDHILPAETMLTLGINDYIPAVHASHFPAEGDIQNMTTTETMIFYLENINSQVDYADCNRYFRFQ